MQNNRNSLERYKNGMKHHTQWTLLYSHHRKLLLHGKQFKLSESKFKLLFFFLINLTLKFFTILMWLTALTLNPNRNPKPSLTISHIWCKLKTETFTDRFQNTSFSLNHSIMFHLKSPHFAKVQNFLVFVLVPIVNIPECQ